MDFPQPNVLSIVALGSDFLGSGQSRRLWRNLYGHLLWLNSRARGLGENIGPKKNGRR
jgi:hypothetical protein